MAKTPTSLYSLDEVEALVDFYAERSSVRSIRWLVRFWDIDRALREMPPKEYQSVLLIGLIGLDTRSVGRALGVDYTTAWRRYRRGLEWIVNFLNGGHGR